MLPVDYVVEGFVALFATIGIYQFYFYCQRRPWRRAVTLSTRFDDAVIPYRPSWVWVYSFLYYPVIILAMRVIESPRHFTLLAASYVILLFVQMAFFLAWPVTVPPAWRARNKRRTAAERYLAFVQSLDGPANCFPSMHSSVAMLTALHLLPILGPWTFAIPLLIGLSCVFTKQHYAVDVPFGWLLGWAVFVLYRSVF